MWNRLLKLVSFFAIIEVLTACYLFFLVFGRKRLPGIPKPKFLIKPSEELELLQEKNKKGETWIRTKRMEDITISSYDGLKLSASMLWNEDKTEKVIIAVHGYRGTPSKFFAASAKFYYDLGYNILFLHDRAHGNSEGNFIGFGWIDRLDVCNWCNYLVELFQGKIQIVLLGVSMGGATVMMASGENLPGQVKCIIEDCGFTNVWNQLKAGFPKKIPIPRNLTLHLSGLISLFVQGYSFKEADALKQLQKNKRPILLIHGNSDDFVPICSAYDAYDATKGDKQLLIVDGAGHTLSYLKNTKLYEKTVEDFLEKYLV